MLVVRTRRRRRAAVADPAQVHEVRRQIQSVREQVLKSQPSHVVFLFSGTTYIQGTRGNRPIRQAQALLRQGIPVIFSYHRFHVDDPLPAYGQPCLVQSPVDITLSMMKSIAEADFGSASRIFVVSYPYPPASEAVSLFRKQGWTLLYDCRDDWEEFSKVGAAHWYDRDVERRLVQECDATLCVADPLCEKMQRMSRDSRVVLSPNAVEADYLPTDYQRRPVTQPQVVGYFGHLSPAWFDWGAFLQITEQCPQYQFEVIGHSAPEGLRLPPNLFVLGPKPWGQLHEYAARWSAAVIPFRMGPLADGVDPIKIYEYLSFGLPVVSFHIPQIVGYPYTQVVFNVADFCTALELACETEPDPQVIRNFISHNTWEVRVRQLLKLADEVSG
jgi:glycosyltransferase involved in cell wall biosynthesis